MKQENREFFLSGKAAVVTGGGRGIGRVLAGGLALHGANLLIAARTQDELEKSASEIAGEVAALAPRIRHPRIVAARCDVSSESGCRQLIGKCMKEFGRIDILVNNAGVYGPIGEFAENDMEYWRETIEINLLGTVYCSKYAIIEMRKNKSGRILNLSGAGAGAKNVPGCISAYYSSKAAVTAFTEAVAKENAGYGIFMNAIAPGGINTKLVEDALNAGPVLGGEAYAQAMKQKETGGDSPEPALKLVLFLCSEASAGLTGKLFSAKWDRWDEFEGRKDELIKSSLYNLRRIDGLFFLEKGEK